MSIGKLINRTTKNEPPMFGDAEIVSVEIIVTAKNGSKHTLCGQIAIEDQQRQIVPGSIVRTPWETEIESRWRWTITGVSVTTSVYEVENP